MRIAGVIAEYNPFHSGHAYHLAETRRRTHADYVVVCMVGSYVQRGEAACLSKWDRARMALMNGADAVFELPALFAVRTADVFAFGGAATLSGLGVDVLSFGSETEDVSILQTLADFKTNEPEPLTLRIKTHLAEGMSHAKAWGLAVSEILGVDETLLNAPNMILGTEYLRALRKIDSPMEILPVRRIGEYHDDVLGTAHFASATAIRKAMREDRHAEAIEFIPKNARGIWRSASPMHAPDDLLLMRLRAMSESEIRALPDVSEGLECRVKRLAAQADSQETLIDQIKCKRYTRARISRLCAHALLGLTDEIVRRHPIPEYARLIGMRADAAPLLRELKRRASLELCSDPAQLRDSEIFEWDCRATDLRALHCNRAEDRRAGQEFTQKFVRV